MADVKWIKLYVDMFDNKKIKFIRNLPEGSDILLCWIMLLTSAGKCNTNGFIFLTENVPYTIDMLSNEFNIPLNTIRLAIETFKNLRMINEENGVLYVSAWDEYQNIEGMDKIREQNRIRKQNERERKKLLGSGRVTVTEEVTPSHAIDIDIDIEEDKELIINNIPEDATENERTILNYLKGVTGYTIDYKKDLSFIRELAIDFPKADILEKIKEWKTWLSNHPLTKKSNPRLQIRNWIKPKDWGKGGSKGGANKQSTGKVQESNKYDAAKAGSFFK